MKLKYKYIKLKAEKDFKLAEKLKNNGWQIVESCLWSITLMKEDK